MGVPPEEEPSKTKSSDVEGKRRNIYVNWVSLKAAKSTARSEERARELINSASFFSSPPSPVVTSAGSRQRRSDSSIRQKQGSNVQVHHLDLPAQEHPTRAVSKVSSFLLPLSLTADANSRSSSFFEQQELILVFSLRTFACGLIQSRKHVLLAAGHPPKFVSLARSDFRSSFDASRFELTSLLLSVFPVFGATTPQIAMLPLLAILAITAFKDGIEDYRRASLDDQVRFVFPVSS